MSPRRLVRTPAHLLATALAIVAVGFAGLVGYVAGNVAREDEQSQQQRDAAQRQADRKLCDAIHGYIQDSVDRSRSRLAQIAYYRQHPEELEDALRESQRGADRFQAVCDNLYERGT